MWFWQNLDNSVIGVIWQQFKHRSQFVDYSFTLNKSACVGQYRAAMVFESVHVRSVKFTSILWWLL